MVFTPPSWAGQLPPIPDSIPISEFMISGQYGRNPFQSSKDPFTCGITGKSYSWSEVAERVSYLSRALAEELGWGPNKGSEWDKTLVIFGWNTIDTLPLSWATHQLGGIVSPANAAYSVQELKHQLLDSKAKAVITCLPLLSTALEAASLAGLSRDHIYLIDLPPQVINGAEAPANFKYLSQLVETGKTLPEVEKLNWTAGEGARRTAYLCYSSGTSGLPKGAMISHRNVIANVLQIATFEKTWRDRLVPRGSRTQHTETTLGLLPQSHIYALVVTCHAGPFRGDQVIVLPKFELKTYLSAIETHQIRGLFLVPPIIISMLRNHELCSRYNLSSIATIFTGAAPLGLETATDLQKAYPNVIIRQGYGLTETSPLVCSTHVDDVLFGSSGSLLPGYEARIISPEGCEITTYNTPGELVLRSPSVVLGYLGNEKATMETFKDGWMHTGDEAVIRLSPNNNEHIFIVDRIKELIKVKGMQVAPAELEAHLLTHSAVADCAVIAVADESAGEVPKAIVVKSPAARTVDETIIYKSIIKHVGDHKARHKWLKGGVRFVEAIPKSPSGKILRRLLRDREKVARGKGGAKI